MGEKTNEEGSENFAHERLSPVSHLLLCTICISIDAFASLNAEAV